MPHHSVPRLGSACPHSGPVPRAAATGHPWPGAAKSASLPIYPLHRAYLRPSWLTGPADQNQKQIKIKGTQPRWRSTAATGGVALLFCGSGLAREKPESAAFIQDASVIVNDLREQARSHIFWTVPAADFDLAFALQHSSRPVGRCALDLLLILILGAPLNHAGRTQALERG